MNVKIVENFALQKNDGFFVNIFDCRIFFIFLNNRLRGQLLWRLELYRIYYSLQ